MKAALCKRLDGPEGIEIEDIPAPAAGRGEAVVAVKAAALNFFDTLITRGKYQTKPELPFSPACEIAGRGAAVGGGVRVAEHSVDEAIAIDVAGAEGGQVAVFVVACGVADLGVARKAAVVVVVAVRAEGRALRVETAGVPGAVSVDVRGGVHARVQIFVAEIEGALRAVVAVRDRPDGAAAFDAGLGAVAEESVVALGGGGALGGRVAGACVGHRRVVVATGEREEEGRRQQGVQGLSNRAHGVTNTMRVGGGLPDGVKFVN